MIKILLFGTTKMSYTNCDNKGPFESGVLASVAVAAAAAATALRVPNRLPASAGSRRCLAKSSDCWKNTRNEEATQKNKIQI